MPEQSRLYRTPGVVIRRQDFGEADRLLTVYTPALGKLRLLAKGAKKPTSRLGGNVELLVWARLLVARGRNLDLVTQAETVEAYHALRADPPRSAQALYCAELLNRLTEEGEHPGNEAIWTLLLATLERIDRGRAPELARLWFSFHLLTHLGYRPQLDQCVGCEAELRPAPNYFSGRSGGALCPDCGRHDPAARPLPVATLKVLRAMQRGDWPALERLRLDTALRLDLEGVLDSLIRQIHERDLNAEKLLHAVRG